MSTAGKHRGPSPPEGPASPPQPPVFQLTHSVKRAFRRARLRAHNSPNQGTWYRGKWHTTSSLGQLPQPLHRNPRRAQPHPSGWKRPVPQLHVLSWNASGLSSALFQEFMAWCDLQSQLDIVVIQETHWHATGDFCTGPWLAMHTSGRDDPAGFGRCSGILFLLRRHKFQDPRILELLPGRLALVQATSKQTKLPLSLIGVYQHVWRSGLPTSRNQELRRCLWDKLDQVILTTPQRHHLLACGDFNATLHTEPPIAGPSVVTSPSGHDSDLQALMQKHSMCALNTWHASPAGTYYSSAGCTQIDYIFTRQSSASLLAKYARPDHGFPVGGDRLSGHYPLRASLPLRSFSRSQPQDSQPAAAPIDLPALQAAVHSATPEACHMQSCVAQRLTQVDVTNLVSAHKQVNRILLEEAAAAFPRQAPIDNRVSARPEFRVSARSVWHLYHELKRPRVCTVPEILAKWRLAVQFAKASRLLKQQSRHLKRQFYEAQVMQAEQAAQRGDQRSLHLIVKRLSPKQRSIVSSPRRGRPPPFEPGGNAAYSCLQQYSSRTFSAKLDDHPRLPLTQALVVTAQDITTELRKLGLSKAVPRHIAPSAMWKLCSAELGEVLSQALCAHLQPGSAAQLEEDWKNCFIVWIPKPGKPTADVSSLRPIGLSSPASKAFAGSLRAHLLAGLEPAMRQLPQFAYAKHRGTADALVRAHSHFEEVARLLLETQCTRFQKQAGGRTRACIGGLGLSLDLSKAFDGVTRAHIYQSMQSRGVSSDVITLVQQLHHRAQYIYCSGSQNGFTTTSNGIKQGCVIAPYLWNYFSLLFLSRLAAQRGDEWIRRVLTLFADDVWGAWVIRSELDLDQAVLDVSLILETLESLDMTINYTKTAILLRLVGRDASRLRRQHTYMKAGRLYLRVWVHGRECGTPIKDQHEYLGTVVTYRHRHQRNMQHRLQACAGRYQGLRKLLNGSHHLTEQHRLWQACICTSAMYAQHVVGVTSRTLQQLTVVLTRHLRAILRIPAHLTHVTTGDVWKRAGIPLPGWTVQHTQQQFLAKLVSRASSTPDITTEPAAIAHVQGQVDSLTATLLEAAADLAKATPAPPTVNCPFCQEVFVTENAMRVHCGIQHKSVPQHSTKTPTVFKPELHSQAGMPACRLCGRQFWRWAHLVSHIETGACRCLGGESDVRAPKSYDLAPAPVQLPPTANLGIFADENAQHTPLVQRSEFLNRLDRWEQWLGIPAVRLELAQHCVLCHFWVADSRHMKQHLNKAHLHNRPHLMQTAINMCHSFKSHLRRDSSCIWCSHKVGAPGRHVTQCTPLVQLCLAVAHCQDVHGSPRLPSQRRGGDICQLLAGPSRVSSQPEPTQPGQPVAEAPSPEPSVAVAESPPQPPAQPECPPIWKAFLRSRRNSSASAQDPVRLLTRVVLQQEQTISRLRHDKGFVLFMKQGEDGTLGALMKVAREWNAQKSQDNSKVTSPLRTVLLSSMTRELLKLAQQAVATEENKARMVKAEWLTSASEWTYRKWNHTERRLEVDSNRPPLQHAEIVRILTYLLENLTGEAIQRFNSTVQLPKPEQKGAQMATFGLEVSLRGQNATELYQGFERLCSNSIMSLIGVSMKKDTLPQSPAARTLANLYYQR